MRPRRQVQRTEVSEEPSLFGERWVRVVSSEALSQVISGLGLVVRVRVSRVRLGLGLVGLVGLVKG